MKIVNEKGKLFGIINVVDLLALLAILVVIGGVGFRLISAKMEEAGMKKTELTAVILVRGANEVYQQILKENDPVGQVTISGTEYLEDSYIESIELEDYYQQISTEDGRIINSLDPVKKNIIFTVKGMVEHDDGPIVRWGVQDMRPGHTCTIKTTGIEINGTIISVKLADEEAEEKRNRKREEDSDANTSQTSNQNAEDAE